MLKSLSHVTVRSSDFDRSERFYCGLLGLREGPRPAFSVPGRWFYLGESAVLHMLPKLAGTDTAARRGAIDHFALQASGLASFEQRLCAAGQPFDLRHQPATGEWQLFMTDPDGALVELNFADSEARYG